MNDELLVNLQGFLGRTSKATYAGNGNETKSWRKGFRELEYGEGKWYYRDSYSGYLRSWGQEVVWLNDEPVWTCLYGGGMTQNHMDGNFAEKTFSFLKEALSEGDKETTFQPRGPKEFIVGSWRYHCELEGDIDKFSGHEFIEYEREIVFTHDFFGGTIIS